MMCEQVAKNAMATAGEPQEPVPATDLPLPPEVWEQIFLNLDSPSLQHVRLTCRHWRAIVSGSPRLMDRLPLRLCDSDMPYISDFVRREATRVTLSEVMLRQPAELPALGERLTHLMIAEQDYLSVPALLGLLQRTPNLKSLKLYGQFQYPDAEIPHADFRLEKMEIFTVYHAVDSVAQQHLPMFGAIFPHVKRFDFSGELDVHVIHFIESVSSTLEELCVVAEESSGHLKIAEIDGLKLKSVRMEWGRNTARYGSDLTDIVLEFCRKQPAIEELAVDLRMTNQEICEIARCLPGLKTLWCGIGASEDVVCFGNIPRNLSPEELNAEIKQRCPTNPFNSSLVYMQQKCGSFAELFSTLCRKRCLSMNDANASPPTKYSTFYAVVDFKVKH